MQLNILPLALLASSASIVTAGVLPPRDVTENPAGVLRRASLTGQATYYGGNVQGGACSFSTWTLPSGILGTALSDSNWDTSGNCGACVSVTGPTGNSITAVIVDECPGCGPNHLDLFPTAFTSLAAASLGIIDISWSYITCPITTPLILHNKEGVSAYWFSMQVVNANQAVASLQVSTDGGATWKDTTRQTYNFFEYTSGFGTTTVDVKVTAEDGSIVVVEGVEVESGSSTTAGSNFGISNSGSSSSLSATSTSTTTIAAPSSTTIPTTTTTTSSPPIETESTIPIETIVPTSQSTPTTTTVIPIQTSEPAATTTTTTTANPVETSSFSTQTQTTSLIIVTVTASAGVSKSSGEGCPVDGRGDL